MGRKKMGEILIEKEIISQQTLDQALLKQNYTRKPIGQILAEMNMVLEEDIAEGLSTQFNIPYLKQFSRFEIPAEALDKVAAEEALDQLVFPLKIEHKTLLLAMANPLDINLQKELSFKLGMRISPIVATPAEIKLAISKHYTIPVVTEAGKEELVVLHVDSHELVLNAVERVLQKEGFTVHKATTDVEGLRLAELLQPQLIITEIHLPKIDGNAMFKALQKNCDTMDIPVIVLSTRTSAEDEYQLLEAGFFDVLAKPVDPTRLLARVRHTLRYSPRVQ
ncbi:MAG: response regulator [Deltaproteobacteria bacterium]|nr:response regulator [Deltaproteobacteria bacterium]